MGCCTSQQDQEVKKTKTLKPKPHSRKMSIKQGNFVKFFECKVTKNYELGDTWLEDGYYEVKIGTEKKTGLQRAIKSILVDANDRYKNDKVLDEVEVLRKLDHPNIIKVYEVYDDKIYLHIVTELWRRIIRKNGPNGKFFRKSGS
ncbi:unnamed protein product [Blepharisma stoltei]|uniref:non-specific serine/threonine protein kinase n=1 Tax=Blepharisma stoltei TaxID=1481888 RepID=A0AAU9JYJ7_9CILI|nr:unnamed protein product [Blepharisma stoltei]